MVVTSLTRSSHLDLGTLAIQIEPSEKDSSNATLSEPLAACVKFTMQLRLADDAGWSFTAWPQRKGQFPLVIISFMGAAEISTMSDNRRQWALGRTPCFSAVCW